MDAAAIWALFPRGLALVWAFAFVSAAVQVRALAGQRGLRPLVELHAAIRRDFAAPWRWLWFPTLLPARCPDWLLGALPWIGAMSALSIVWGGEHTPYAFAACYLCWLSLDRTLGLVYPWDSLLFEAGLWATAWPALAPLPELRVAAPPEPALVWLYRLLLFRVMFGFGKQKFVGSTRADRGFLHGFMVRQPLPTPLGWWAARLPGSVHRGLLAVLFVAEIVMPFGAFFPGAPSVAFATSTTLLMLGIAATGNYGHFNLLTIAISLVLLDVEASRALSFAAITSSSPSALALHAAIALHTVGGMLCLPLNTWASFTWTLWPWWRRLPAPFRAVGALFRWLAPSRWLHPYGVFPPRSAPPVKFSPVLEVSDDGVTWRRLRLRYWPSDTRSPPRFVAPHHPRVDHAVVYEATGFDECSALRGLTGRWDPYGHTRAPGSARLVNQVLRHGADEAWFVEASARPRQARIHLYALEIETTRPGVWWREQRVAPQLPPAELGAPALDVALPVPELWHGEDWLWLERSRFGARFHAARRGASAHELVLDEAEGLDAAARDAFWCEFVPQAARELDPSWSTLRAQCFALRARFTVDELARYERLVARYGALLAARIEPMWLRGGLGALFGVAPAPLPAKNHHELRILAELQVARGRARFDEIWADATPLAGERFDLATASFFRALFRYENAVFQAQKYRLLASQLDVVGYPKTERGALGRHAGVVARRLWSAFDQLALHAERLRESEHADVPETHLRYALERDGTLRRVEE